MNVDYKTEFQGCFRINKPLDESTYTFLRNFSFCERIGLDTLENKFGVEGEFYNTPKNHINSLNRPPRTQPNFRCNWTIAPDKQTVVWNQDKNFEDYVQWIEYIISKILAPRGYELNGIVQWRGERFDDNGTIKIENNVVNGKRLIVDYSINKLLGEVSKVTKPRVSKTASKIIAEKKNEAEREIKIKELEVTIGNLQKAIADVQKSYSEKVADLETQLAKEKEAKANDKKIKVQDVMLEKFRIKCEFNGELDEFKILLRSLL
jgi:hypothetical protein